MSRPFRVAGEISVQAPIERCFALSTSIEVVELVLGMRPVRGCTSGLVTGGATVCWRGFKFGLPQVHESLIEAFEPPVFFRDRMIAGRFASFEHGHSFTAHPDGTVMLRDEVRFTMRWGAPGALAGRYLLVPHIRGLLRRRFALIKRLAEGDEWQRYLPSPAMSVLSGGRSAKSA